MPRQGGIEWQRRGSLPSRTISNDMRFDFLAPMRTYMLWFVLQMQLLVHSFSNHVEGQFAPATIHVHRPKRSEGQSLNTTASGRGNPGTAQG